MFDLTLTFDNGPTTLTPQVLDLLAEHGVQSTFFMVGQQLADRRRIGPTDRFIQTRTTADGTTRMSLAIDVTFTAARHRRDDLVKRLLDVARLAVLATAIAGVWPVAASAQVRVPEGARVVYGHHHLNVTSLAAHRKFWIDGLGGVETTMTGLPTMIVRLPGVLILLREKAPSGDMHDSVVPTIGFDVRSLAETTATLKAAGFDATSGVAPGTATVTAPDGLAIELVENRAMQGPIGLRDLQFSVADPAAVRSWYAQMFGAIVQSDTALTAAALPGLRLIFRPSAVAPAGTAGRVLDHIGFEVTHLEDFCAELQRKGATLARPYTKLPSANLAIAFLTDPWGTYIELTEGLARVQ